MGVIDWFQSFTGKDGYVDLSNPMVTEIKAEMYAKVLATQICINLIANTLARGEFLTYKNGKEFIGDDYYDFNVSPNQNKNSSKFWREVVAKLLLDNECLVIQQDGNYYKAESFNKLEYAFKDNIYKNITIANYNLKGIYLESDVLYFELHNNPMKKILKAFCDDYSKLIAVSKSRYKKHGSHKAILKTTANISKRKEDQDNLRELLEKKFKKFFEAEGDAVMPLNEKYSFEELENNIKIKGNEETREIRALIDDVFDFVALAFQIPPQLLKGSVADTDKAFNNYLTYCINPIAELITDEMNRKLYGRKAFLERTYVKLDTTRIRHVDIKDIAGSLDILTRIGANTINDNLRILGRERINESWGDERFMTKNYERVEEIIRGGE